MRVLTVVFVSECRAIYNMCTQKPPYDYSQELYDRYEAAFNQYIHSKVLPTLVEKKGEYMLKSLVTRWENHKIMVRWLSRFFNYLDRYFVQRHHIPTLKDVGVGCFRRLVYDEVKPSMRAAVLELIEKERDGEKVDRALIKNVIAIFVEMGLGTMSAYETDFEKDLLSHTAAFYGRKATQWIAEDSCPAYLIKAEECIVSELERVQTYLHQNTESKLISQVETNLLAQFETELLEKENSGCAALLIDDKTEDLSRMFRLFSSVPKGLQPIADIFKAHIQKEGMALVTSADQAAATMKEKKEEKPTSSSTSIEQSFTRSTIELYDKYNGYVKTCFGDSSQFNRALKEAFEFFLNKGVDGNSTAQLLADFSDKLLRKGGSEKLSDEKMEETLDKVVKLLGYISDKDLFGEFYRKKLSRRLLQDSSASQDYERSILSKLKTQCGTQFTSRMEGMVTDLQLARETQDAFERWVDEEPETRKTAIELNVTILTHGFWPQYKLIELALPEELIQCVEVFKEFYDKRMSQRKLSWVYSLGQVVMTVKYNSKSIEMVMQTFQCAILLLFRTETEVTVTSVCEKLKMPAEDAKRALHSLSCGKYKILIKSPEGKTIAPEDVFTFNDKFTDRSRRIKIPMPPVDEKKATVEHVETDRRHAIDAAIVRVMKTRKSLAYSQLLIEVVSQLQQKFSPEMKMIKQRIEEMINREYLERDRENQSVFKYVA